MRHKKKKMVKVETIPKLTQVLALSDNHIQRVIIILCYMFKMLEEKNKKCYMET